MCFYIFSFFFQAEDGIRDKLETGVQTCALPIWNMVVEARYVGSRGHELLESRAFNQGYDLNAGDVPEHIFERFNQAYAAAGSPNGPLNDGATAAAYAWLNRSKMCSGTSSSGSTRRTPRRAARTGL